MTKPGAMRDQMPIVAEFIDQCRAAFGLDSVNSSIRAAMAGQPSFYAEEGGRSIGTKDRAPGFSVGGETLMDSLRVRVKAK